jgi:hypothetical protein
MFALCTGSVAVTQFTYRRRDLPAAAAGFSRLQGIIGRLVRSGGTSDTGLRPI